MSSLSQNGYAAETGRRWLPSIVFRSGSLASSGMPLAARVRATALYTRRAVCQALRALASWPGTARGTVSSCDDHQSGAAEALQLEQDERETQV
jgi:hypothetical protein